MQFHNEGLVTALVSVLRIRKLILLKRMKYKCVLLSKSYNVIYAKYDRKIIITPRTWKLDQKSVCCFRLHVSSLSSSAKTSMSVWVLLLLSFLWVNCREMSQEMSRELDDTLSRPVVMFCVLNSSLPLPLLLLHTTFLVWFDLQQCGLFRISVALPKRKQQKPLIFLGHLRRKCDYFEKGELRRVTILAYTSMLESGTEKLVNHRTLIFEIA